MAVNPEETTEKAVVSGENLLPKKRGRKPGSKNKKEKVEKVSKNLKEEKNKKSSTRGRKKVVETKTVEIVEKETIPTTKKRTIKNINVSSKNNSNNNGSVENTIAISSIPKAKRTLHLNLSNINKSNIVDDNINNSSTINDVKNNTEFQPETTINDEKIISNDFEETNAEFENNNVVDEVLDIEPENNDVANDEVLDTEPENNDVANDEVLDTEPENNDVANDEILDVEPENNDVTLNNLILSTSVPHVVDTSVNQNSPFFYEPSVFDKFDINISYVEDDDEIYDENVQENDYTNENNSENEFYNNEDTYYNDTEESNKEDVYSDTEKSNEENVYNDIEKLNEEDIHSDIEKFDDEDIYDEDNNEDNTVSLENTSENYILNDLLQKLFEEENETNEIVDNNLEDENLNENKEIINENNENLDQNEEIIDDIQVDNIETNDTKNTNNLFEDADITEKINYYDSTLNDIFKDISEEISEESEKNEEVEEITEIEEETSEQSNSTYYNLDELFENLFKEDNEENNSEITEEILDEGNIDLNQNTENDFEEKNDECNLFEIDDDNEFDFSSDEVFDIYALKNDIFDIEENNIQELNDIDEFEENVDKTNLENNDNDDNEFDFVSDETFDIYALKNDIPDIEADNLEMVSETDNTDNWDNSEEAKEDIEEENNVKLDLLEEDNLDEDKSDDSNITFGLIKDESENEQDFVKEAADNVIDISPIFKKFSFDDSPIIDNVQSNDINNLLNNNSNNNVVAQKENNVIDINNTSPTSDVSSENADSILNLDIPQIKNDISNLVNSSNLEYNDGLDYSTVLTPNVNVEVENDNDNDNILNNINNDIAEELLSNIDFLDSAIKEMSSQNNIIAEKNLTNDVKENEQFFEDILNITNENIEENIVENNIPDIDNQDTEENTVENNIQDNNNADIEENIVENNIQDTDNQDTEENTVENNIQDNNNDDLKNNDDEENYIEDDVIENLLSEALASSDFKDNFKNELLLEVLSEEDNDEFTNSNPKDTSSTIVDSLSKAISEFENNPDTDNDNSKKEENKNVENTIEETKIPDAIDEDLIGNIQTLIISEKAQKVYLPYTLEDILHKLNDNDKYETIQDVIDNEYTVPLSNFNMPIISRFKETYRFMRTKEKSSIRSAIDFSLQLMFNSNLHPAIIRACENLKELNSYLDCLHENKTDEFEYFKIVYSNLPK